MIFGLDYDGTYNKDPVLWESFIRNATSRGHEVIMVTMRWPHEELEHTPSCEVHYSCRKAKHDFMHKSKGIYIDVWIDDMPMFVHTDAFVVG